MVITRIQGGLGNQLFTYAFGYVTSRLNNEKLILDISDYRNGYFRKYMLEDFALDPCENISYKYINNKIGRELMRTGLKIKYHYIKEKDPFEYQGDIVIKSKNTYLYGYWQNEKYFNSYSSDIRRQFKPKKVSVNVKNFMDRIIGQNSTAIHIRRGDYTQINWIMNMRYYYEAMDFICRKISNPIFHFFSDDIEWTKKQFGVKENYEFVEFEGNDSDLDEFISMSKCNNLIIANSTFSWWAAWLNGNSEKIIVAPAFRKWTGDYYPSQWIQINANQEE